MISLKICVAKKKQCQLAVLLLTEEKMSVWKTRDCSEAVVTLAMDGVYICAALPSQYLVYNMESMSLTPLFPLEAGVVPTITRTDRGEWVVSGPGNLGMFVKCDGSVSRPPVQWSSSIASITFSQPYIISQDSLTISVYDITDQSLKQGIPYTGGRYLGLCDGHLLLASSARVDILAPVPWQQQAASLLESGHLEEALKMASDNQEGDLIRQKAGFVYLKQAEFEKAEDLLLRAGTDVRELLSLFPGMLPANSRFVRASPPLHDIPDISCIKKCQLPAEQFLVSYLQSLVQQGGAGLAHSLEVHTALVKLLCRLSPTEVVPHLNNENFPLDYDELSEFFESENFHHFLASLHWKRDNREAALKVWSRIVNKEIEDQNFPGLEFFCRHLSQCSETAIYNHCDVPLTLDENLGAKLFMKPQLSIEGESQFIDNTLNILSKYPGAKISFLKFLVFEKESQVERHHTQLALAFISKVKISGGRQTDGQVEGSKDLSKLILTSKHLNANFLLQHLNDTNLNYEKAILHGKLGQHDKALNILVSKLQNYEMAENYCDDISAGEPETTRSHLLLSLLNIYLSPTTDGERDQFTSLAVDLINNRAEDLNGPRVISQLPDHWNISIILPALRKFSRNLVHSQRMTNITKHLQKGENIQLRERLITSTRDPVTVMSNHYCPCCQKGFGVGNIARYPNGVLIHESCVKSQEICPVTGQVFRIKHLS